MSMCTYEYRLYTQARYMHTYEHKQSVFFNISKRLLIKNHPKHALAPPKVSGFHLNLSHNKTQAFTSLKQIKLKDQSKN